MPADRRHEFCPEHAQVVKRKEFWSVVAAATVAVLAVVGWFASATGDGQARLARDVKETYATEDRVDGLETRVEDLRALMLRIEAKLDRSMRSATARRGDPEEG